MAEFSGDGRALYRMLEPLVNANEAQRQQVLENLSFCAADVCIAAARERVRCAVGNFDFIRGETPPRVTGMIARNGVLVDKVILEPRPGIFCCGLFFRTEKCTGKLPAILGTCGHAPDGKAELNYQAFAFGLARKGFAVFLFDPPGQGEARQYRTSVSSVVEHNRFGKVFFAAGIQSAGVFIHDARCALDYLLSRPEVDPDSAGVTGCSGGGQMSYYLFALDDRVKIAASVCHMNTFQTLFRNEIVVDAESAPCGLLSIGGDRPDFAIAGAPKPLLLIGAEDDYLDSRGLRKAYGEISAVYRAIHAEDRIQLEIHPGKHGYSQILRESMYRFFTTHFFGREDGREDPFEPLSTEECFCTPGGNVLDLPGAKREQEYALDSINPKERLRPEEIGAFLRTTLDLPDTPHFSGDYRTPRPVRLNEKQWLSRFVIETDPDVPGVALLVTDGDHPLVPGGEQCHLYIAHLDAKKEFADMRGELDSEKRLFALDVRGIGESRSTAGVCDETDFFSPFGRESFIETFSRLLARPLLAGKIRDVAAAVFLLYSHGYHEIHLTGYGLGGLVAMYTLAALRVPVADAQIIGIPESLETLLRTDFSRCPQSHLVPGMLRRFDLPDLRKAVETAVPVRWHLLPDIPAQFQAEFVTRLVCPAFQRHV